MLTVFVQEYLEYRKRLKSSMKYMMEIQKTLVMHLLVESWIENLPQVAMTSAFLISESQHKYGKLLTIVSNSVAQYTGGNFMILCILMGFIQANKFTWTILTIRNYHQYPLGNGILGTMILLLTITTMMGAKILLIAIIFSNSLFLLPLVMILELGILLLYCKALRIKTSWMKTIFPCLISSCVMKIENNDYRPRVSKDKFEVTCAVAIPLLNLLLVYLPLYIFIEHTDYLDLYKSFNSPLTHAVITCFFILLVFTYLPLHFIFKKYGDPWRHIQYTECHQDESANTKTVEDPNSQIEESIGLLQMTEQPGPRINQALQDPATKSIMVSNRHEIQKKIKDGTT